jgi:hypothetical protein
MSVEKVNGFNKLPQKDLRKTAPRKAGSGEGAKKSSDPSETVKSKKSGASSKARSSSKDWVDISIKNEEGVSSVDSASLTELVSAASEQKLNAAENQAGDKASIASSQDLVEISLRDPELVERIQELMDKIRTEREDISKRIEAARMLIMRRAYDDDQEVKKTAEAILRGEDVDGFDLNDL